MPHDDATVAAGITWPPRRRPVWQKAGILLLLVVAFAQSPLFSENQNTKFMAGAASAGYGYLDDDWMAGTLDPLPVFSALVRAVFRYADPGLFYLLFALMVAVYGWSLLGIASKTVPRLGEPLVGVVFLGLFFAANGRFLLGGIDGGLAGQYLLGDYFQPCVLGALLLAAVNLYLSHRLIAAAAAMTLAAVCHPFYIPVSLLLLAAFGVACVYGGRPKRDLLAAAVIFVLCVAPLMVQYKTAFAPTSAESWRQSIHILSELRIPHHTQVAVFFSHKTVIKIALMLWALWLARKTRLFGPMAVLLAPIVFFIPYLGFFPDANLSYATPWRTSVILFPLSVTFLLARFSGVVVDQAKARAIDSARVRQIALGVIALAVGLGVLDHFLRFNAYRNGPEAPVIAYARANARKGITCLIPPKRTGFQKFRLETGLPVFANWKTHPFKDTEVLAWYERNRLALSFYENLDDPAVCRMVETFRDVYGVTHAVVEASGALSRCPGVVERYADANFRVMVFVKGTQP